MANYYDLATEYFNSVSGASSQAFPDAAIAYFKYKLANPSDGAVPAATSTSVGGVKVASNVSVAAASTATDVTGAVADLNTLISKFNGVLSALQASGAMAS